MGFGQNISMLPPWQEWLWVPCHHPLLGLACPHSAFQRGIFVLLKLLFKSLLCWFIPAVSDPLKTTGCLPVSAFGMEAA